MYRTSLIYTRDIVKNNTSKTDILPQTNLAIFLGFLRSAVVTDPTCYVGPTFIREPRMSNN